MEDIARELQFIEEGEDYAKLCVDLTLYWRGSAFDRAAGIVQFYERLVKLIGADLRFFETGTMAGAKPIKKDTLDMVPFWFQKAKRREDFYIINLESGRHPNEPSDRAFYLIADEEDEEPVGAVKASFPVAVAAHPDRYVELVRDLVEGFSFESGHAGYSLNWDARGDMAPEAELKMHYVAQRFLGVDLFSLDTTLISMRKTKAGGVKCANWLTLLGRDLAGRIGPQEEIASRLGPACRVESLGQGALLIRAGDAPLLGERNRNADMSAYRSVGRLLAPYRFVDHRQIFGSPNPADPEPTSAWLARFDR